MGEVYAVASGKGGTGKTSVCAGLATTLAQSGQRVLCIDCDIGLRNLDISLGMSDCAGLSFLDVIRDGYPLADAPRHPAFPTLSFLTAPITCHAAEIDSDAFRRLAAQGKDDFDYVFLDAPAGVGAGFQLVSDAADRFLVVTSSGPASIRDAARVGDLLDLAGKRQVRLIVNRVERDMLRALRMTIDDIMDIAGMPLLGIVPEDPEVTLSAALGKPLITSRRSPAADACRRIAGRLCGSYVPIPFR